MNRGAATILTVASTLFLLTACSPVGYIVGGIAVAASSGGGGSGTVSRPGVPAGVAATPGDAQVTVQFDAVPTPTSYNIYWDTVTGVTKATGNQIAGVSTTYDHLGRANGTTYCYVVTAVNRGGESWESTEAAKVTAGAAPSRRTPRVGSSRPDTASARPTT